ncbi:polycystin-1 isoform X5 [Rhinopithecus roxellana]|uniref:polycystin-1 isoform X5 n=1 Tax=Rhinopithecus roxellana TaxID=61622 RepID=UPI0012379C7A|nr:polycystin-1 isoform X5 [Rhinopithecus roxellana]
MPPAAPARLALVLVLGLSLWLGALAGDPGRGCGPCAPPCLCGPAPGAACRVNCSGRGLRTLGPALRIPADATALDVSHNLLRALDVGLLANLSALSELDISNNKISTLEEGIFANLFNLSEINLSGNPFECDCGLAWLPRWAEEQQVRVVQPEAATCAGPGSLAGQPLLGIPLLDSGCGEEYVACLPDNSSGTVAAVAFSAAHEGLLQPEACSAFCFSTGRGLAALSEQGWCLCGAAQPSSASFACLSFCSGPLPPPAPDCGGPTLLQHVFPASPGAALVGPHGPLASGQPAAFHIAAPLPVTATRWDFGDGSPEVDAAGPAASHRYVLPGRYHVTAVVALGVGSALLGTNVQVEAAPAALELVCPSSVQSDESLKLSIQNRGGSGLEAAYSIVAVGEELARVVHPLCPSDTEIFPGNGHCYRLVVEKAAWLQAQEQCRAWAGAALAMVDSPAVQRFLVSRVTRSLDVWIGFSTVQGAEAGLAPQGEAFSLESCQNWLPGEPHPATAEHCVRLGPTGWCNTDLCSAPHSYVCELRPGGPVQDAENLLVGAPSGDLQGPLTPLAPQDGLSAPHEPVEVMVFPGLSLSHEAFLTTAEFGTQELRRPAQLRLQVYRLLSAAGTLENGSEPESRSLDNRTQLVPECMPGGRWCPAANVCVPLDASCHPQAGANGCTSGPGLPGALYALWREFLFSVPAGPPAQYSRYSPVVEAGSDVVFRWTINDKQSLTFQNVVFNVIYQSAAVFKLSLTASNHVSNVTVNYNVTVERMNRMQGLWVSTVPAVLPPNATLALTAGVLVDSAVEVAFLWTFGDGEQALHQFQPPYNESFPVPDPSVAQVLVEHNVTHTYAAPGEYILTVLTSNAFENLTQQVPVSVRAALPSMAVGVSDSVLVAGRPITFYPHPLPSPGGVLYTWDFGDSSPVLTQSQPAANHTYASRGTYCVHLEVNNTVSSALAQADVRVFEELRGLSVDMSLAVEQGAPVVVSAAVQTGDDITWTFDMGDGTVLSGPEDTVEHVYLRAQNCTVTVAAASPAGHLARSLHVLVFVLEVLRIEPAACIPTQPDARLTAYVTGNPAHYLFDWTFGDGSSNTTVQGRPTVTHNFTRSGTFPLALVLSSRVNKAHYFTSICVEPEVGNVTLQPERQFVQLGDEVRLMACVWPPFPYRYTWDFGTEEAAPARVGGPEVTFTYRDPGSYLVTVTASNNVSAANDSALVEVQEPVVVTDIKVNSSLMLELQQPYLFSAVGRGHPASYLWDLGDGGRLEGPEVTHAYNSIGDFTVRVAGWNEVSRSEAWLNVTVKRRVRGLVVNASRTVVPLNGSVSFSTSLEAGSDVRYSWVLCDRCTPIPGGPTISYTFRSVGTFSIIVTAENEVGSAQDSIFVYVLQLIEGLQVVGCGSYFPTNHTVQLQAVVKDGTNISYSWTAWWDRGPALAGSGKGFSLTALEAGTYHVQLRATNMLGSAWADCNVDFVEPVGWLKVAASPNPAAVNTSVTLSAELAGGSGVLYTWSLEEGLSWETPEPFTTHSFPAPGLHLVTVTAGNPLGSASATVEVGVQVPVNGLSIRAGESGGSFVAAGSSVPFWGQLATGTNVSWCWAVPGGSSKRGPHVTMVFPDAGTFSVQLNASNAVSWVSATHNLTVEDPIVGLVLWASSKVVAPGQLVHFQILLAAGSAVTFRLQVGGASPAVLPGPRFSHSFPRVGDHVVSVQGENHVSWAQAQVRIVVLEAVSGLQVPNCCEPGIATGTERNFTARVQRGSRVAYAWYFSLQKVQGDSLVILSGRDVTYTPVAAGLLEIQVRAFNALGSENRTLVLEVQDTVQYVALRSGPCFTNRSAWFEAATSPSPRRVAYHWDFGDGAPGQDTDEPRAEHCYLRPGDYRVQVNASNLVSFFVAQATVTVQVLACREPEVDVVLPLQVLMRRSQRNYLEAHVDLRDCVTYQTEYRWEVYRTASCQRPGRPTRVSLPGVDVSRPQLVLPRLVLPVGHYCFVFVVSFGDTPLARSIQANVTVAPERLVPIIEGGSYRVWSDTQDLVLDGSESYDPNLEDGDQTPLSFHWACVASTQREAGGCALNFGPRGSSMVTIPRERLAAGVEYTFSLTVWKAGRKEEATNQTVLIRSGRVPIVSLECVSCKAQAVYEVSRSSYVYLEGRCLNCSSGSKRGRWAARTFSNKTLVLDETTTSTGSAGMRLVLRRGVLRDGEGYTFTLTVLGQSGEEEGCASIRLSPNRPPLGGSCRLFPLGNVHALTTKVHFECTGWHDAEDAGAPLLYALLLQRCRQGHCEEFCVYKGSLSSYGAVLPPGFGPHFEVGLAVVVQDQLGAAVVALNRSLAIALPEPNGSTTGLTVWLHGLTASVLPGLLRQADPQHVIEYSLALVTVLNEYEQALDVAAEPEHERQSRAQIRKNVTQTLVSLRVHTVDDIQQIAAALAQSMGPSRELVCRSCLKQTLHKLEAMMRILQAETTAGTVTPTAIGDSILNITGDLIHLASSDVWGPQPSELGTESPSQMVASQAYNLTSALMRILMRSRVLNEEPLTLAGEEIVAQGKRSDPRSLLCYGGAPGPGCHFSIPEAFSGALANLSDVVQLIFLVDSNPFPFGYISNYTVSTKVASMAFQTQAGAQIPIERLASERAITVKVPNNSDWAAKGQRSSADSVVVQPQASVGAVVTLDSSNPAAGLHLQLNYTLLDGRYLSEEPEPYLAVYLHSEPRPNEHNCSASRRIRPESLEGADHRPYTFFIAPGTGEQAGSYHLNLTSHFRWSALEVSVGLYTSLCQYFSEEDMVWRTEGLLPLEETSPHQAVCLTRHLTAFGASLFVPPSHVRFVFPEPTAGVNYIVMLTCAVCLVTYAVMAAILHKLDQLDASRGRAIPFCGQRGRFKYEILVKTGWGRGSGTTAHVGIMLYGVDSRSGHRHLDGDRAFHRNSLDIFQIATPHSLGSVWKIRVWHDNKGLSPAWFLQHVIVKDLQTARSAFFLVNDWLSVETEANGGLVEKEVLAASDAALLRFRRLLVAELQRGFFDKHIWLSIWDRPPRSRFTRIQRATCCVLLICLFLGANAMWYGAVGDSTYSAGRVSRLRPLSVDTVAVGLVSSVVVYPIYLAVLFLFRMSRSKVAGGLSPTPARQQVLDIDSCLDSSVLDSSFLTFPGLHAEQAFAGQMKSNLFLDDSKSLVCWPSSEGTLSWPDLLSDPSIVGSNPRQLARGQTGHGLGPEEDGFSLASPYSPAKSSASDEDLMQQVLAKGVSSPAPTQDTHMETDLLTSLSSTPGEKTEMLELQRLGELGPPSPGLTWERPQAARLSRTGLVEGLRKRLLPAWCTSLAHGFSLLLVAVAVAVSGWVGVGFPPGVSVAWLLSSTTSFLASFLGWEPLKVLLEALYFSLVAKRLHPDEDDTLVESPAVTPVSARVPRVRPPHGFALFLAKEEARKVKRLHGMLRAPKHRCSGLCVCPQVGSRAGCVLPLLSQSLLVYMLFLLVTLLASYGDASCHGHAYRLQSAIKQELHSRTFLAITRSEELWPWMAHVLLPYVHGNQSSPELGPPRLRQVRLQEALCPDPPGPRVHTCSAAGGFSTSDYDVGWESPHNGSGTWVYSAPDLLGAWSWGSCAVYDSGGYVQELGLSLEESRDRLRFLQLHNWLDNRSRAVFVELTRYSPAVGLHAAVTLRLEFPAAGRAVAALSVRPFALRRLSAGLSLPLLTSVCLLLFALHFAVAEARTWHREGCWRVLRPRAWARWLLVVLTAATALVRLAQLGAADRQWTRFVRGRPRRFTSFDQVAQLSSAARGLAASLLFLLLVKAAQQLRFVRQWSVFGKTLFRALPELLGATLGLVVLGVAYAQLAVLLVSSCVDSLRSVAQALLVLCSGTGLSTLCPAESWHLSPLLCVGLWALRLWGALRLGAVILRWRYHALRGELYRPAWEPQDYEMVELFLRRLRLWMGLSKVKEFRHKVRFEGMEPLPSRSSRGSKVPPDVPPPSAGSDASHPSTSSSQLDGLGVSLGRLGTRSEPEPSRLQAVFEALLTQFDRLNQATEDVYQLEQQLHSLQGRRSSRAPAGPSRGPSPGLRPALPSRLARASRGVDLATGPSRTSLWVKNKVHPSST